MLVRPQVLVGRGFAIMLFTRTVCERLQVRRLTYLVQCVEETSSTTL
jgi:hypothetical protein